MPPVVAERLDVGEESLTKINAFLEREFRAQIQEKRMEGSQRLTLKIKSGLGGLMRSCSIKIPGVHLEIFQGLALFEHKSLPETITVTFVSKGFPGRAPQTVEVSGYLLRRKDTQEYVHETFYRWEVTKSQ